MNKTRPAPVIPILAVPAAAGADEALMVSMYEKQAKVYPRAVTGLFARWRWTMVWLTQLVFYGMPWLTWNGRQAVLFDLNERRFHIFGLLLQPQDLIYLAALLVISALALFLFTAVAGRLWCGYTCPQTVYTEIFMWAERQIEGDRIARMRLDQAPWGVNKILRKGAKQGVWLAIALITGFSFVGYFTPIRELAAAAVGLDMSAWNAFWVLFYGAATYGNAGFLREQMCKYMCPYARFQSALIDKDSLVIAYDAGRGDPRGSRSKKTNAAAQGLGDCCRVALRVAGKDEVSRRGQDVEAERREVGGQRVAGGDDGGAGLLEIRLVCDGGDGGDDGEAVERVRVEAVLDPFERLDQSAVADGEADAQAGQGAGFR